MQRIQEVVAGVKAAAYTVQRVWQALVALRDAGADRATAAEALQSSIATSEAAEAESSSAADALMTQVHTPRVLRATYHAAPDLPQPVCCSFPQ